MAKAKPAAPAAAKEGAAPKKKGNFFKSFGRFFSEVRSEFRKIVWPSRKTAMNNVIVVLGVCLSVGVVIWIVDALLSLILTYGLKG